MEDNESDMFVSDADETSEADSLKSIKNSASVMSVSSIDVSAQCKKAVHLFFFQ